MKVRCNRWCEIKVKWYQDILLFVYFTEPSGERQLACEQTS